MGYLLLLKYQNIVALNNANLIVHGALSRKHELAQMRDFVRGFPAVFIRYSHNMT